MIILIVVFVRCCPCCRCGARGRGNIAEGRGANATEMSDYAKSLDYPMTCYYPPNGQPPRGYPHPPAYCEEDYGDEASAVMYDPSMVSFGVIVYLVLF